MDLPVLRPPESENHIFNVWLVYVCVCVCASLCVCVYICVSLAGITQKQIAAETSNIGILHLYHMQMLLETFYKDQTKILCTGAHTRILIH